MIDKRVMDIMAEFKKERIAYWVSQGPGEAHTVAYFQRLDPTYWLWSTTLLLRILEAGLEVPDERSSPW